MGVFRGKKTAGQDGKDERNRVSLRDGDPGNDSRAICWLACLSVLCDTAIAAGQPRNESSNVSEAKTRI